MVALETLGFVLAAASTREEKPNAAMQGAAIRSRSDCSLWYASTKRSEPPSVRKVSITAYRTSATTNAFTSASFRPPVGLETYRVVASRIPNRFVWTNCQLGWPGVSNLKSLLGPAWDLRAEPVFGRKAFHGNGDRRWTVCPGNDT